VDAHDSTLARRVDEDTFGVLKPEQVIVDISLIVSLAA